MGEGGEGEYLKFHTFHTYYTYLSSQLYIQNSTVYTRAISAHIQHTYPTNSARKYKIYNDNKITLKTTFRLKLWLQIVQ